MKRRWWVLFPVLGVLASAGIALVVPGGVPDRVAGIVLAAVFAGWIVREMARG
jgi:hypothetical protein